MIALLESLPVGARFRVAGRTARLLHVNASRALVQYDDEDTHVVVGDAEWTRHGKPVSIAPRSEVEPMEAA